MMRRGDPRCQQPLLSGVGGPTLLDVLRHPGPPADSEFRGECRTFGPGEYANLPGLNNVISSGRRISNYYPYADRPDWRDNYRPSQGSVSPGALNRR